MLLEITSLILLPHKQHETEHLLNIVDYYKMVLQTVIMTLSSGTAEKELRINNKVALWKMVLVKSDIYQYKLSKQSKKNKTNTVH